MNSRRDFLKLSAAVSAWTVGGVQAAVSVSPTNFTPSAVDVYKVLGDQRYAASVAFVDAARAHGLTGHLLTQGDVSKFWLHELQSVWQSKPVALAGLTDAAALFCFEQLGAQYGLRVIQRDPVVTQQDIPLVAWLIAPRLS